MPSEQAQDAFFTLKSDRAQRDMALAAGTTALAEHPALLERFKATLEKINDLAGERNAAVHTMWAIDWQYWGGPSFYFAKIGVAPGAIPHEKLNEDFVAQFAELNQKLHEQFVELQIEFTSQRDWAACFFMEDNDELARDYERTARPCARNDRTKLRRGPRSSKGGAGPLLKEHGNVCSWH